MPSKTPRFRALEKTPADRYPSMKEFAEALGEAEAEASLLRTSARRAAGTPRTPQQMPIGTRRTTAKIMRPGGTRQTPVQEMEEEVPPSGRRKWLIGGGVAVLLAIAGIVGSRFLGGRGAGTATAGATDKDARRVAVLYFQSSGDSLRYLANGLTEGLISQLAQVPELEVISRNGVAQFQGKDVPRDSIARTLQVGTLVEGNVEQDKDRVRVTVRLIDAASNAEFQRATFEEPAGSALSLSDSVAQKAALFLRERLGVELRLREQRSSTKSGEAWILLQRAEQARKEAEAAAAQGDSVSSNARFTAADSIARLASERDPSWNEPVVFRGRLYYRRSRLAVENPAQAKVFIDQGMGLAETALGRDNADPDALELRGTLEYWKWLLRLEQNPAAAAALFASARKDLEDGDPTQADAGWRLGLAEPPLLPSPTTPAKPTSCWRPVAPTSRTRTWRMPRRSWSDCSTATTTSTRPSTPRTGAMRVPSLPRERRVHHLPALRHDDAGPEPRPGEGLAAGQQRGACEGPERRLPRIQKLDARIMVAASSRVPA